MQLHQDDCFAVMEQMEPGSVHLVLVDPPYQITGQEWDIRLPLERLWSAYAHILAPTGSAVLTATNPFAAELVASKLDWYKHDWVWQKTRASNFAAAKRQPLRKHELVLVFSPNKYTYNPIKTPGKEYKSRTQHVRENTAYGSFSGGGDWNPNEIRGDRYPSSVIEVASMRQQDLLHPTEKPVQLMEYLIKTYSNPGDTVLDHCMGSGSTGVAALASGRQFIGIEKHPNIFEVARKRLESWAPKDNVS